MLRPLVNQPQITLFMATIGLAFFIEGLAQLMWGANVRGLELGLQDEPIQWISDSTGMNISKFDLAAAGVAAVLVAVLAVFFSRTRIGRALRAVADDHQAALAVGIPLRQIWDRVERRRRGGAGSGLLWGARSGVQYALTFVALALPVLILGGFESVPGVRRSHHRRNREACRVISAPLSAAASRAGSLMCSRSSSCSFGGGLFGEDHPAHMRNRFL